MSELKGVVPIKQHASIISGQVLTTQGFVDIEKITIGTIILDSNGNNRVVKGIVTGELQDRKAVIIGDCVFADDQAYIAPNGKKCVVNFANYVKSITEEPVDGEAKGKYTRHNLLYLAKDTDLDFEVKEMPASTRMYSLIIENSDFVQMKGVTVSCARYII